MQAVLGFFSLGGGALLYKGVEAVRLISAHNEPYKPPQQTTNAHLSHRVGEKNEINSKKLIFFLLLLEG